MHLGRTVFAQLISAIHPQQFARLAERFPCRRAARTLLVALVRAGAVFHKGKLLERPVDITPPEPADNPATPTGTEVA